MNVKIYKEPNPNEVYAIGADVAEGLETGDFSSAFVINKELEQVASYHGHCDPDLFGRFLCRLGQHYNSALLAPEVNNHGFTTLSVIKNAQYPHVYFRMVKEEMSDAYTKKLGWNSNMKTKTKMLDDFVGAYRDHSIQINDVDLLREMLSVTIESDGGVNLNGKDRVVAAAIALQAINQAISEGFEAYVPGKNKKMPTTKKEKLEKLSRRMVHESNFE